MHCHVPFFALWLVYFIFGRRRDGFDDLTVFFEFNVFVSRVKRGIALVDLEYKEMGAVLRVVDRPALVSNKGATAKACTRQWCSRTCHSKNSRYRESVTPASTRLHTHSKNLQGCEVIQMDCSLFFSASTLRLKLRPMYWSWPIPLLILIKEIRIFLYV